MGGHPKTTHQVEMKSENDEAAITCQLDLLASTALRHSETEMLELNESDSSKSSSAKPSPSLTSANSTQPNYFSPNGTKSQSEPKYIAPVSPALLPSPYLSASSPNLTRTLHNGRSRSDSVATADGSEAGRRSSPPSPSTSIGKRSREASGGQEWTEEEKAAFYRVKQQLAAIHPKLRIGASRNVGVGRVRLQCKVGVTVSTIKTFGVEEIGEILRVAQEWAQERGAEEDLESSSKQRQGPRTPKGRSQSVDITSNNSPRQAHPLTPHVTSNSTTPPHTTPLTLAPALRSNTPHPAPRHSHLTELEKERRIKVFCERLTEFLSAELRQLV